MAKAKGGENTKKAAGNAKKAEAAARKQAEIDSKNAAVEDAYWSEGSKNKPSKKELAAKKAEEAKASKAARDAELEAETAAAAKKKPVINQKKAAKKSGIDAALEASSASGGSRASDLYAHNIDDAIAALEIAGGKNGDKIDRHPERRFKPALRAYEERRLPEMREEHPGLRLNQYQQRIYEEFQKSPENPFNQVKAAYNASQQDISATRKKVQESKEERLTR